MSWAEHHSQSELYASEAEIMFRQQEFERAQELYRLAAGCETRAYQDLDPAKARTLGITAVSAASLWYKGKEYQRAEQIIYQSLSEGSLPPFAAEQLKDLLQSIWNQSTLEKAGVEFMPGEVLVSVSGGKVVHGGAPLDLITVKIDQISRTFYRVIEMLLNVPFRRHGNPKPEIREQFRPWLLQAPAGSYQFAVRVERPKQLRLPLYPDTAPSIEHITQTFLDIVKASADDPDGELVNLVSDTDYRTTFLKLTRNLTPTGKTFGRLEMRVPSDVHSSPIVLVPESREAISTSLKKAAADRNATQEEPKTIQLQGTLRALHLDDDWLELHIPEGEGARSVRIRDAGEAIDDVVGPMVNRPVTIEVIEKRKGTYSYRDIQLDE